MKKFIFGIKTIIVKFFKDSCFVRASGLAYSSLLAMVPFTTVIYAFGGFDTLGKTLSRIIVDALVPEQQEVVLDVINNFTRNSLATGTMGMAFYLVTSLFLINTIASNFDTIWGVEAKSGFFRRFTTYTAILVFSSLFLGLSTSFTGIIERTLDELTQSGISGNSQTFTMFLTFLITVGIFFILLIFIPSAKIKISSAAKGAVFSALVFEFVKWIFRIWVLGRLQASPIYGSLVIIPMFLVGLYLFWLIVLIGVEVTFYIEHKQDPADGNPENLNMEERLTIGIDLFIAISDAYRSQTGGGVTLVELKKRVHLPYIILSYFLSIFTKNNLILRVDDKKRSYIPCRSLDKIKLKDIVDAIYGSENRIHLDGAQALDCAKLFTKSGYDGLYDGSMLDFITEKRES